MSASLIFTSFCVIVLHYQVTRHKVQTNVLKNVLVMFLSVPQVFKSYLIQINKISFVEMGKKSGISGVQEILRFSD